MKNKEMSGLVTSPIGYYLLSSSKLIPTDGGGRWQVQLRHRPLPNLVFITTIEMTPD